MTLTDRDREILACLVEAWDEDGCPLPGDVSYADALGLLDRLGVRRPPGLVAFLDECGRKREDPK